MVQTSRKVGGQRAPRSKKVRKGSVANASQRANLPEAIINSTASPGVGILIDPGKIMAKDSEPYYVVIDGKRIYGSSADNVIEKISGITNVSEAPLNRNGESGVGSLINVKKAKEGSPDKYYIVIKGKRYYGNSQEKAIEVAKSANHGSRTWKQYRKHVGNKVRKGLSSATSAVGKRMTRTRNASVARTNRSKPSIFRNPFKRKRPSVAPVNTPMNATSTANSTTNSTANSNANSTATSNATSNANSTANSTNTSSANNTSANNSSSTSTV